MKRKPTVQVRLTEELAKLADAARELCSPASSLNSFVELLLSEMVNLLETEKGSRRVPNIIAQMDATRQNQATRATFDSAINSSKVDQAKKLMETCRDFDKGMVGFFALCLFCGIRTEEVLKLQRPAVDLARSIVTVDVGVSKTRRRRIVSIPGNCLAWLKVECTLPVVNWQARYNAVREAAKLRSGWGQDCMRHSFGSYHYALTRDAAATAAEMGNSPEILFRHYRELVTRGQAVEFFGIKP